MTHKYRQVSSTAERLKVAMALRGKKQIDLVRETEIDKGSISHYVSGKYEPKQEAVNKLAIVLDVDEMWLWGYDVPMNRKKSFDETDLTEGEIALIELYRRIPVDRREIVLNMIKAAFSDNQ